MSDNACFVEILGHTQAIATIAGAGGVVEGEEFRFEFVNGMTTLRTGVACREQCLVSIAIHRTDASKAIGQFECRLKGLSQPQSEIFTNLEPINDNINAMLFLLVELGDVVEVTDNAIDTNADKTGCSCLLKHM